MNYILTLKETIARKNEHLGITQFVFKKTFNGIMIILYIRNKNFNFNFMKIYMTSLLLLLFVDTEKDSDKNKRYNETQIKNLQYKEESANMKAHDRMYVSCSLEEMTLNCNCP